MRHAIDEWATRLAEAAVPDEAELAADVADAYIAGGRDRDELFRSSASVPGGFDPGAMMVAFPFVLSAVVASGQLLRWLLDSGVASLPSLVRDVIELRDRRRGNTGRPDEGDASPARSEHAELSRTFDTIVAELADSGMEPERGELIAGRVLRALLDDPRGTRTFLDTVDPVAEP
ncbi:hypothetical protein [Embleya scabrispora]|uniref:hypothetical protein n=1 Tax=Embleya scabrispora TaxID=159449 RepID=UPI0003A1B6EA|nr:hypothetical protein [Embleya scabrispora]MYS86058.1 hypothetical protein [Streptomyces sp. SID5474]